MQVANMHHKYQQLIDQAGMRGKIIIGRSLKPVFPQVFPVGVYLFPVLAG